MKKSLIVAMAVLLLIPVVAQQRKVEGKGEEYHHAMYLNLKHSADEAQALYSQISLNRDLNMEIANQHFEEIWNSLDAVRVQHAMIHKTFGEQQSTLVAENHETILKSYDKAIDACKILKKEMGNGKPDINVLRTQSALVYQNTLKAATEHTEGMKKLGIPMMQAPL